MSGVAATAAVKARLEAVANIGRVYNMLGNPTTEAGFKDRFVDGDKILAWEVTREGSTGVDLYAQAMKRVQQIVIYGYMSFKDGESETVFQALVDAICAVFDPIQQRRFDEAFDGSGPLQVDGPKFAVKGNYVVHFVRMTFPVEEFPIS
jgi:hypothetical protein